MVFTRDDCAYFAGFFCFLNRDSCKDCPDYAPNSDLEPDYPDDDVVLV